MPETTNAASLIEAAHDLGAKGTPATESERLLFEAWMKGHCWALSAHWDGQTYVGSAEHGDYLDPRAMNTRQLWAAWRDRAALSTAGAEPTGWLPITPELLNEIDEGNHGSEFWLYGPNHNPPSVGRYEWREGRYPHTFVMGSIVCGTGGITHVMPYSPPPAPKE